MSGHISLIITRSPHSGIAHSLIGRRFSRSFTSSPCITSKARFRNCISSFSVIFMTNTFGTLRCAIAFIEDSRSACVPDSSGYRKLTPVLYCIVALLKPSATRVPSLRDFSINEFQWLISFYSLVGDCRRWSLYHSRSDALPVAGGAGRRPVALRPAPVSL